MLPFVLYLTLFGSSAFPQPDLFLKVRELRSQRQYDQALSLVREATLKVQDKEPNRIFEMFQGLLLMDKGDWQGAQGSFNALSDDKSPLAEYVHYFLGLSYLKAGRGDLARQHMERVLHLSPNLRLQHETEFQLALLQLENNNYKQARLSLRKLEKRQRQEESYPEILYQLARAERGLHDRASFCKWARRLYSRYPNFQKIVEWGPNLQTDILDGKQTTCFVSNEDKRTRIKNLQWAGMSERAWREIAELRKNVSESDKFEMDRMEVLYNFHEGDLVKALQILKPYYELKKNNFDYLVLMGNVAARAGESQLAVGSYYRAYRLNPRSKLGKQALFQAAFMSYQFQDYDGAARKFQEFMKFYPTSPLSLDSRWNLAWIRYLRADYDGAYTALNELKKLVGKGSGKRKRRHSVASSFSLDRVNYWMAMSLYRQEKYEEAKPIFEALSRDSLLGYYALAAQYRYKKLEALMPKAPRISLTAASRSAGFYSQQIPLPSDDFIKGAEQGESEENLSITDLEKASEPEAEPDILAEDILSEQPEAEETEKLVPFSQPIMVKRFERARQLLTLGLTDWAKWDLYDIERRTNNREYLKTLMSEYEEAGVYNRSSYIGQVYFGSQRGLHGVEGIRYLWEHTYPLAYSNFVFEYSKRFGIPTELIWGIMRAESQYKPDVISPVGALGLMQVMPSTGTKMSQILGEKGFVPSRMMEPDVGIKIGSGYLQRLYKKFEGNVALVAAAYNAGPHRVKSWLSSFGQLDLDEFIEHIPFVETRNYVKKVLSNFHVYSYLYNSKKAPLSQLAEPLGLRVAEPYPMKESWDDI